jgi:RNA polymerase sigma-70 factor, ECF subfamily
MDVKSLELTVPFPRDDDDLASLARRAQSGQAGAFEELAGRVRNRVRGWASFLTGDADDAEDVAQQVLLALHAHVDRFEGRSRFTTWLFALTRNVALNRRRTAERRRALLARHAMESASLSTDTLVDEAAIRLADLARLYRTELTPRQREVFELSDVQGFNATEIAERLRIAPATVRGLLLRARRTIRLRMLEHHSELLEEYRS